MAKQKDNEDSLKDKDRRKVKIQNCYLFGLDKSFASFIKPGEIDDELLKAFEIYSLPISQGDEIEEQDNEWVIKSNPYTYRIEQIGNNFEIYRDPRFETDIKLTSIIKIKEQKLAAVFNSIMDNPGIQEHAEEYWRKLKEECEEPQIDLKEIKFLIKYLFLDSFGCAVPPFIDFEPIIENGRFKKITLYKHDYVDKLLTTGGDTPVSPVSPLKENQSGW